MTNVLVVQASSGRIAMGHKQESIGKTIIRAKIVIVEWRDLVVRLVVRPNLTLELGALHSIHPYHYCE